MFLAMATGSWHFSERALFDFPSEARLALFALQILHLRTPLLRGGLGCCWRGSGHLGDGRSDYDGLELQWWMSHAGYLAKQKPIEWRRGGSSFVIAAVREVQC